MIYAGKETPGVELPYQGPFLRKDTIYFIYSPDDLIRGHPGLANIHGVTDELVLARQETPQDVDGGTCFIDVTGNAQISGSSTDFMIPVDEKARDKTVKNWPGGKAVLGGPVIIYRSEDCPRL